MLSNEAITQLVGHEAFARALVYARSGHVRDVELDDEAMVITRPGPGDLPRRLRGRRPPGQLRVPVQVSAYRTPVHLSRS